MKAHEEMETELHLFLTSVLNGGQLSASRLLNRKMDGPQRQPDLLENRKNLYIVGTVYHLVIYFQFNKVQIAFYD